MTTVSTLAAEVVGALARGDFPHAHLHPDYLGPDVWAEVWRQLGEAAEDLRPAYAVVVGPGGEVTHAARLRHLGAAPSTATETARTCDYQGWR